MNNFSSPYLDFPIPSDIVSKKELELAREADLPRYAKLVTIDRLRDKADYFKYLPKINMGVLNNNEKNALAENLSQIKNPNYYLNNGTDIYTHPLMEWLDASNILNLKPNELPPFRQPLSTFLGTMKIKDYVHNEENKMQILHWIVNSKIFDTKDSPIGQNFLDAFDVEDNWTRNFENSLELYNNRTIIDIELTDKIRKKDMLKSERNFAEGVLSDRLGFFEDINVLTNPDYANKLAYSSYATDNRRQFKPTDLVSFVKNTKINDFINYRFNAISINNVDYLEVEWAFPKAEAAKNLAGNAVFDAKQTLAVYGSI